MDSLAPTLTSAQRFTACLPCLACFPPYSFSVGAASLVSPGLGFDSSFLEEPVMLLAFVLLGRAMEARAKVREEQ
jgi:cation transport ATPase